MRRFLRRLRKGLKTACLTAVLATCWQVGQPAQALATTVPLNFSGTVSPTANSISNLFLIYGTGFSGVYQDFHAIKLGDFSAGQTTPFSVTGTATYDDEIYWAAAGLYGDTSGGQYTEGVNGVTLCVMAREGDPWSWKMSISEETMFQYLLNNDYENLAQDHFRTGHINPYVHVPYDLFDFSEASINGEIYVEAEIVPEPITIILLGAGGIVVLRRRRHQD